MIPLRPIHKSIRKELHLRERALVGNVNSRITEPKDPDGFTAMQYMSKVPWVRMISPVDSTVIIKKKTDKEIAKEESEQGKKSSDVSGKVKKTTELPNTTGLGGLKIPVIGGGYLSKGKNLDYKIKNKFDDIYNTDLWKTHRDALQANNLDAGNFGTRLRNRPIPGIESVNVSYEGGFKALRKAEIKWKCHTLEDLDALMPHFLTAGRSVILEFGWWYANRKLGTLNVIDVGKMLESTGDRTRLSNTFDYTYDNFGNTEIFSGIISDFDYTVGDDGSFDCTTSVISEGVDLFKRELSTQDANTDITEEDEKGPLSKLNFNDFINHFGDSMLENHNPQKLAKDTDGNMHIFKQGGFIDDMLYVSWGWFEDNIISKFLGTTLDNSTSLIEMRSYDEFEGDEFHEPAEGAQGPSGFSVIRQSVKITNHKYLYSPELTKFILPGQIYPKIYAEIINAQHTPYLESIKRINEYSSPFADVDDEGTINKQKYGYLRNILLSWKTIQNAFGGAETLSAGFDQLFKDLDADLGIWDFQLVLATDTRSGAKNRLKVVDHNTIPIDSDSPDDPYPNSKYKDGKVEGMVYEFPTWTKHSIVRAQNFTVSIPDNFAIAAMYGNNDIDGIASEDIGESKALYLSTMETNTSTEKSMFSDLIKSGLGIPKFDEKYGSITADLTEELTENHNSPSSIFNDVESKVTTAKIEKGESLSGEVETKVTYGGFWGFARKALGFDSDEVIAAEEKEEELKEEIENFNKFTEKNGKLDVTEFYILSDDIVRINPIYKDIMQKILQYRIGDDDNNKRMLLIPFNLEVEVDGIGGIVPGNSFTSFYLPKRYKNKKDGIIFQVINVEHDISAGDWVTKIEGIMSYKRIPLVKDGTEADDVIQHLLRDKEKQLAKASKSLKKAEAAESQSRIDRDKKLRDAMFG